MVLSSQLSNQLSNHLIFGPFSKGVQRLDEGRSTRPLLGAFRGLCRASQLLLLFASALGREKAETGQKQASSAHVDKRAAPVKNAPRMPSESFSRPHEKAPATPRPGTGKPRRPDTKKAAKPAARHQKSTIQPLHVNFQPTFSPENRSSCKANVNQCKLFSHFVLSHFHASEVRNYTTFSTLHTDFQYQTISHFVLCPVSVDWLFYYNEFLR